MAILMNYSFYVEFLDSMLHKHGKNKKISILEENFFVALTSKEMIVRVRLLSILHISMCVPIHWLAGKTHELEAHSWGPISMVPVLDTLEKKMKQMSNYPHKIVDESFMMCIFTEFANELPE